MPNWDELSTETPDWSTLSAAAPNWEDLQPRPPSALSMKPEPTPFQQAMQGFTGWLGKQATKYPVQKEELGEYGALPEGILGADPSAAAATKMFGEIVPQTEGQTLMMLGTLGGAKLASKLAMRAVPAALTRTVGAAGGRGVGELLAGGEDIPTKMFETGAAAGVMESAAGLLGKVFSMAGGGAIKRRSAHDIGKTVGEISPELAGAKTAADLRDIAYTSASKGKITKALDDFEAKYGDKKVLISTIDDNPITVREALAEKRQFGYQGYGGSKANIIKRTMAGQPARATHAAIDEELRLNLAVPSIMGGKSAVPEYDAANAAYSKGKELIDMFRQSGAVKGGTPTGPTLDLNKLGSYINENQAMLEQYLGKAEFDKLADVVTRGGPLGARDVPFAGRERPYTAVTRKLGREYAGAPSPFSVPPAARTIADIIAAREPEETLKGAGVAGMGLYQLLKRGVAPVRRYIP